MRTNLPGDWEPASAGGAKFVAIRGDTETIATAEFDHTGRKIAVWNDSAITSEIKGQVVADAADLESLVDEVVEMMERGYFDQE